MRIGTQHMSGSAPDHASWRARKSVACTVRRFLYFLTFAVLAQPAAADAVRKTLYAQNGPVVSGISYCYAVMSGREGLDSAARKRGFKTPTDARGNVYALDKPRPRRRVWVRTYAGPNAGTSAQLDFSQISVSVRYRETKCEVHVTGVPKSYAAQVYPVTMQVFGKLDRNLKPDNTIPFSKILVAGKGPSWHGGLYFKSKKFSGRISFDIPRKGNAVWGVDLVRSDILRKKYGG